MELVCIFRGKDGTKSLGMFPITSMKGKCVLHDTNAVIPEESLHSFNYNMVTFPPLLLKLQFLRIAIKEMTCYKNLNAYMRFPDKSVCVLEGSQSPGFGAMHYAVPRLCLPPFKKWAMGGWVARQVLYKAGNPHIWKPLCFYPQLNFLKPHHLVSLFSSLTC